MEKGPRDRSNFEVIDNGKKYIPRPGQNSKTADLYGGRTDLLPKWAREMQQNRRHPSKHSVNNDGDDNNPPPAA